MNKQNLDMKNRLRLFVPVIAILISTMAIAQSKETRQLEDFDAINVGEAIDVLLIAGNTNKAALQVRGIDLEDVLTDVSGGTLKIHLASGNYNNTDVEIVLTYKSINKLKVSSAADVKSQNAIKANDLELVVSSAGEAELELAVDNLEVDISSSGGLTVSGSARTQEIEVSSAGSYNGTDLKSEEADIKVSSAGSAKCNASKILNASASSGGTIRYTGDPDKIRENASSGGSVKSY